MGLGLGIIKTSSKSIRNNYLLKQNMSTRFTVSLPIINLKIPMSYKNILIEKKTALQR
jgi:hypothetical protein